MQLTINFVVEFDNSQSKNSRQRLTNSFNEKVYNSGSYQGKMNTRMKSILHTSFSNKEVREKKRYSTSNEKSRKHKAIKGDPMSRNIMSLMKMNNIVISK